MKILLTTILTLLIFTSLFAQAPEAFNYQGVARDLSGTPLPNNNIALRIAVLQGSVNGTEVYKETHGVTTNDLGLFTLQVGTGTTVNGVFDMINWGADSHYLQIEMDENNGTNYQLIGTSQLMSVPYALYAKNGSKWNDSQFSSALQYDKVVVGEDVGDGSVQGIPLIINNAKNTIGLTNNTALMHLQRNYSGSTADFLIYGYPDTDLVANHLRKSVMLYATGDANDMVLCAAQPQGKIRFFTQTWTNPSSERMRINEFGNVGIGTTTPAAKLQVADGDIYIEDINQGVIMKSPNGQCWRLTVDNSGQLIPTAITCPN